MNKKRVCIVGSGPAGLLAAHAAATHGAQVTILSNTAEPSNIYGASYLHKEIPDLELPPPERLRYIKLGTEAEYAAKIYGPKFDPALTSWSRFPDGEQLGWNLRDTYAKLWKQYGHQVLVTDVNSDMLEWLVNDFWLVVNSAPLSNLVKPQYKHLFKSEAVSIGPSPQPVPEGWIAYVGIPEVPFYRESTLWGISTREYPLHYQPCLENVETDIPGPCQTVFKPLSYEGHHLSGVLKVGRYGAWNKQALSDDGYFKVAEAMTS